MNKIKPKAEMIEGPRAFKNFESTMKTLLRVPKSEVEEAERKYKASRKRKKS